MLTILKLMSTDIASGPSTTTDTHRQMMRRRRNLQRSNTINGSDGRNLCIGISITLRTFRESAIVHDYKGFISRDGDDNIDERRANNQQCQQD